MHKPLRWKSAGMRIFILSLRTQLVYFLLPLIVFSAVSIGVMDHTQTRQVHQTVLSTARSVSDYTRSIYEQSDLMYLSMYHNTVMKDVESILTGATVSYEDMRSLKAIMPWLQAIGNAGPIYDSVYIYTSNPFGRFLSSGRESISNVEAAADRKWLDEFETRRSNKDLSWVSTRSYTPYGAVSRLPEKKILTIFRTIGSRCCLMLNLDAFVLSGILENSFVYRNETLFIVDRENTLLLSVNADEARTLPGPLSAVPDGQITEANGCLYTSASIWGDQARVVICVPRASAFAQVRPQLYLLCGILVLCVFFCVLLAYRHSRRDQDRLLALYRMFGDRDNAATSPDLYTRIEQNIVESYIRQGELEKELQKRQYDVQTMELLALQAQINPHFLVNTIMTIFWKCLRLTDGRMNPACHMLENLNGFLTLLTGKPNEAISWQQELVSLRCYLAIQKERYQDRFEFQEQIDPSVLERPVAKLLIQPMIENCFVHAMPEEGVLHISLQVSSDEGGGTLVVIRDDGVGMSDEQLAELEERLNSSASYKHIGLYNVNKRLKLLYGLAKPLDIQTGLGEGTSIRILLPAELNDTMALKKAGSMKGCEANDTAVLYLDAADK